MKDGDVVHVELNEKRTKVEVMGNPKSGWVTVVDRKGKTYKVRTSKVDIGRKAQKAKEAVDGEVSTFDNLKSARPGYHKERIGSGKEAKFLIDSDDETAVELRGLPLDKAYSIAAKELGVTVKSLKERYEHLNPGMQRMNLGNRIRGARAKAAAETEAA